jgi:hypothetical protein
MHGSLVVITNGAVLVIDAMVLVIIAIGTIQAFVQGLRIMLLPSATGHERRNMWLHYARWLVAGLTFSPPISLRPQSLRAGRSWCASRPSQVIRTLLNFFLERDSLRGSQTAIRARRQQVSLMMQRRSGPRRCGSCFASTSRNTLVSFPARREPEENLLGWRPCYGRHWAVCFSRRAVSARA